MLLTADHARMMARCTAWQNAQVMRGVDGVGLKLLTEDHGAHFGTILGTLNHILRADRLWLYRLGVQKTRPEGAIADSSAMAPTGAA